MQSLPSTHRTALGQTFWLIVLALCALAAIAGLLSAQQAAAAGEVEPHPPGLSGTIIIIKDAWPEDDTPFPFTEDISDPPSTFTLKDPSDDTKQFDDVPPDTYTIKELIPDGWTLEQNGCEETVTDNSQGSEDGTVDIMLEPGETVTCTFVNIGPPAAKLTILKSATPRDGTDFPFTIDGLAPLRILYREIFPLGPYGANPGPRQNALDEGWRGYWDGMTVDTTPLTDNTGLQIFGPGTPNFQVAVNSNPVNAGDGMGFWSPAESRVVLYTEEFTFARSRLEQIRYETRHNDGDQPQQDLPLLKIDGKWYSPDCLYVNTDVAGNSTWIPASWQVNSITWMELDIDPATNRAVVPGQDCVATGDFDPPLQTGLAFSSLGTTVEAFGLYLPDPESNPQANMRFDNYTLVGRNDLGDFILDDANPDDGDAYVSGISFFVAPGTATVTELVPAGWNLTNIQCNTEGYAGFTPGDTAAVIELANREDVTCTFFNVKETPPNTCPAEESSSQWTDLLGIGMGNMTSHKIMAKVNIPNWLQTVDLHGQMVAKNMGKANYVRFLYPGVNNFVQVNAITSPPDPAHPAGTFWYGADLNTAAHIRGRWFLQPTGAQRHIPRALVLYPTYASPTNTYVNVWDTFDATEGEVDWNTAGGWVPYREIVVPIAAPLGETDFHVELALVDNDKDQRPVWVTVSAGGVSLTQKPLGPNKSPLLNLMVFNLLDVPAGTDEIVIEVYSPSLALDGVIGESASLVGMVANYQCEELDLP